MYALAHLIFSWPIPRYLVHPLIIIMESRKQKLQVYNLALHKIKVENNENNKNVFEKL